MPPPPTEKVQLEKLHCLCSVGGGGIYRIVVHFIRSRGIQEVIQFTQKKTIKTHLKESATLNVSFSFTVDLQSPWEWERRDVNVENLAFINIFIVICFTDVFNSVKNTLHALIFIFLIQIKASCKIRSYFYRILTQPVSIHLCIYYF